MQPQDVVNKNSNFEMIIRSALPTRKKHTLL